MPEVSSSVITHITQATKQELLKKFHLTPNGLKILNDPTFEEWTSYGHILEEFNESIHFAIGDWLNYGETAFGEPYKRAMEMFNFDFQTLRNDKWISYKVPKERRRGELSFYHHQVVSALEPEEQEKYLQEAVEQKLTGRELKQHIKRAEGIVDEHKEVSVLHRHVEEQEENEQTSLAAQDIIYFSTQLLEKIDALDFATLSPKTRIDVLKHLDAIERRTAGLLMEYADDE